jgi:BirA family biotin operon repressor/biotin-[acetyl-CoA-carboxylase] ligase
MDQKSLIEALAGLPLGGIRFYDSAGSTNTLAAEWAAQGAPDLSLVASNEQTAGRGRQGRTWYTPPGSALALSLVLRPGPEADVTRLARYTALGALAVHSALGRAGAAHAAIKWPNDVLLNGKKTAGVLAETHWSGSQLQAMVLGIGVNVFPASVPDASGLTFPATCAAAELPGPVDRLGLARSILGAVIEWRTRLPTPEFIQAWEARLAYQGERVRISTGTGQPTEGVLKGLTPEGHLVLAVSGTQESVFTAGEVLVRPVDRSAN